MTRWTVVKLGGSLLEDPSLRNETLAAIGSAWQSGMKLVVVHGGGKKIDSTLARLGIPKRTHMGLRVTDQETLEVVVSVLSGLVNKLVVADLQRLGIPAAGISGPDGATLVAGFHPSSDGVDLGFVGAVRHASPTIIEVFASNGILPVVASVALGPDGTLLNVNADAAASAIAVALNAERLVYLTDVPGLLDDKGRIIESISADSVQQMLHLQVVKGGIVPKLKSCVEAVAGGVGEVLITGPQGHTGALLRGKGGTRLVAA
jgi:acetylglutamate kinase